MTSTMEIIKAKSLMLEALDTQIKNAGGDGFNVDVTAEKIKNSFSTLYTFMTPDGPKMLETPNEYMVGTVHAEKSNYVVYFADFNSYELLTREGFDDDGVNVYSHKVLGQTMEDAKKALCKLFPNRIVWNLCDPEVALQAKQ